MDQYEKIFEPPYVHMAKLHNYYHYNVLVELQDYIYFLINFKKGDFIDPAKETDFRLYVREMDKDFETLANLYNQEALNVKSKIKNNRKHLGSDSSRFTNEYIEFIVSKATGQKIEGFDFEKIRLLSDTLDGFFKRMEVGELTMKTNDIVDYLMLSYVQPGDLYYTKDGKWLRLITESGNSHYLYKEGI